MTGMACFSKFVLYPGAAELAESPSGNGQYQLRMVVSQSVHRMRDAHTRILSGSTGFSISDNRSTSVSSALSQRSQLSGSRMTGMRGWIGASSWCAVVVMMVQVSMTWPSAFLLLPVDRRMILACHF
jgi:hypothetical protein